MSQNKDNKINNNEIKSTSNSETNKSLEDLSQASFDFVSSDYLEAGSAEPPQESNDTES